MYGYSKFLFDQYVRNILPEAKSPVCGFGYFNVYGPRENHKGSMASVAFHLNNQILKGENPKIICECSCCRFRLWLSVYAWRYVAAVKYLVLAMLCFRSFTTYVLSILFVFVCFTLAPPQLPRSKARLKPFHSQSI